MQPLFDDVPDLGERSLFAAYEPNKRLKIEDIKPDPIESAMRFFMDLSVEEDKINS